MILRVGEVLSEIVHSCNHASPIGEALSAGLHQISLQEYGNVPQSHEEVLRLIAGFLCLGHVELFESHQTQVFLLHALEGSCETTQGTVLGILHNYFHTEEQIILSLHGIRQDIPDMTTIPKEASHDG